MIKCIAFCNICNTYFISIFCNLSIFVLVEFYTLLQFGMHLFKKKNIFKGPATKNSAVCEV